MSPVQEKVLGMMSELAEDEEGKDLLVRAKTGTGKTLAFLVPGIERRLKMIERQADEELAKAGLSESARPSIVNRLARETMGVIVISPTRELATQIAVSANNLSVHHADQGRGFGVQLFVGGENRRRQMREWVTGRKDIVVGTPGRLRDLLEGWNWETSRGGARTGEMGLKEVFGKSGDCVVILDEADTLLDMGFRSDVEAILGNLKKGNGAEGKQTWMFSATVNRSVEKIVGEVMRKGKWEYVDCVGRGEERDVHSHVKQVHTVVGDGGGMGAFVHLLRLIVHDQLSVMKRNREGEKNLRSKMMVFFSTTKMTKLFGKLLRECADRGMLFPFKKMRVYEMHSKKEMNERVRISKAFRETKADEDEGVVMISSDVSARGVDYPGVSRVVQMGVPGSREGYVHRVGRTGRGDVKEGRGDLVLAPWEMGFLKVLGDVGMEPVTVEGLRGEIETLAEELEGQGIDKGLLAKKVAKIEDFARSVASAGVGEERRRVLVDEDEYRSAWASLVGFYVGSWEGLKLGGLNDVIEGSGRWVEALGGLEQGLLGVGPGSGLPRGVMDRLQKDAQRTTARGRGGKEKAWGSWSRNEGGRSRTERPGGWREQPKWRTDEGRSFGRSEDGNGRDRFGGRREGGGSWGRSGGEERFGGRREAPRWKSEEGGSWGRNGGEERFGGRREEGGSWGRNGGDEKFGAPKWKTEEGGQRSNTKAKPSWMGRGSAQLKRGRW
jgi:ATP-dependent RNA helicase MSS116